MNNNNGYIMTYINPDSDGVCTSIAYSKYLRKNNRFFEPIFYGNLNDETRYILGKAGIEERFKFNEYDPEAKIILVDTHHLIQLPYLTNPKNVIEVIDHHPAGNVEELVNANIKNETIGAAATIIGRLMLEDNYDFQKDVAILICAAIVSNTLNFTAPSTSDEDQKIYNIFNKIAGIDDNFIKLMFECKDTILAKSTKDILLSDFKVFNTDTFKYGISQLELTQTDLLISKNDLHLEMFNLSKESEVDFFLLNIINILERKSYVLACDDKGEEIINKIFKERNKKGKLYIFNRVLLRKTDFVKQIEKICIGV